MATIPLSPEQLDKQCKVKITRWIDMYSEECAVKDPDIDLTKSWYKMLAGDALLLDTHGRIWGKGDNGYWYPYHFNVGSTNYGYRIIAKASN